MPQDLINRRRFLESSAAVAALTSSFPAVVCAEGQKILRIRVDTDFNSGDPIITKGITDQAIIVATLSKLINYKTGETYDWRLDAAQSIEQLDPTHMRFALRPGIMFSNGFGEMTSEDVKYSYERMADPKLKSSNAVDWKLLDRVDIIDKYTGTIVLKEPFPGMWVGTLPRSAGTIVSKKAVQSVGGSYRTEMPCASGPYKLKEWRPNERIVLDRNPVWTGARPDFDEVHIFVITDEKAAELAFEAGQIDFSPVAVSSVPKLTKSPPAGGRIQVKSMTGIEWIGINTEHPNFKDLRARMAIQYAVDREMVLEAAYYGIAKPATGIVAAGVVGHRERRLIEQRDLAKARQLLAEAGVPNGFKATLSVLNSADALTIAQVVQANLAEIGVEVEIRPYDGGTFNNLGFDTRPDWKDIQLYHQKWGLPPDPANMMQWFLPEQIGKWNWERWNDPEFAAMHKASLVEVDQKKRGELFVKMQDRMEGSGAFVWLTNGVVALLYRDTIAPATSADGRWYYFQDFKALG